MFVLSATASAGPPEGVPVTFWIEPSTDTCADAASATARDLALACEASRPACSVASTKRDATRVLVLRCDVSSARSDGVADWSVVAFDLAGERSNATVSGPVAERSRSAAMFAIRFETSDEPGARPVDPATSSPAERGEGERQVPSSGVNDSTGKILTFGGFGLALVAGGVGLASGLVAASKASDLEAQCPNGICARSMQADLESEKTMQSVSMGFLVTAGVGLVTGVVGLVLWSRSEPPATRSPAKSASTVRATAGAGWLTLAGAF